MRLLSEQKKVVQRWQKLERRVADIAELISVTGEEDTSLKAEIESRLDQIASRLDELTGGGF